MCTSKSKGFGSVLVWNHQACFNTAPRRKYIGIALRKVNVAAHQSEKGYTTIFQQLEVHSSKVRKNIQKWKKHSRHLTIFQEWTYQQVQTKVRL